MPPRKFAPTPLETTTRSSRQQQSTTDDSGPKPRRFVPQVVETSQKSSKDQDKPKSAHIKFAPQPVETTYRSSRSSRSDHDGPAQKTVRKFSPVLIDTARRTRRASGSADASHTRYKTESGHHLHAREHRRHITGAETPTGDSEATPLTQAEIESARRTGIPPEQRRSACALNGTRRSNRGIVPERQHSFRCPDLDTIESSESERGSDSSSRSSSPGHGSPITASDSSIPDFYKHATRVRESVDENFSHYLLQLEAKKAEQRLREQALAAFPNSDFHEPVQHYANNDEDSDEMEIEDRPVTWEGFDEDEIMERLVRNRRESTKMPWEQQEMQRHAEQREQDRRADQPTAKQATQASPWWNPVAREQQDNEMRSMRDRARPPMLGQDLSFPRCPSPEPARFDVTQGPAMLRSQMCYLTESAEAARKPEPGGLWSAGGGGAPKDSAPPSSVPSPAKSSTPGAAGKGLWGGFCVDLTDRTQPAGLAPPAAQTGLMTPRTHSGGNPFEQSFHAAAAAAAGPAAHALKTPGTPPTPPRSVKDLDMGYIDAVLVTTASPTRSVDDAVAREYPDSFITQVYNYLSLGYPSLARPFDDELAKIARVPLAELRADDALARRAPRGYIRLGPDFEGGGGGGGDDGVLPPDGCARWKALKLYVHEWARQEKNMVAGDFAGGNWGTTARRGSWAW